MLLTRPVQRCFLWPAIAILLAPAAAAQGGGGLPEGVTREQMWPAPTAADWQLPVLIQWQRSYEDALAVARETGKPILVCINMDGEIASEHYAGIRYRQPEIAALYEPYVCVIASVYRHNPRDHDDEGRRIVCPRFGTVTCGEHIAIEPGLFEKFMDGRRIAPRHIMVEPDQAEAEVYDVYYAWDTDSVFQAIREGVAGRPSGPAVVRGDRSIVERVASADSRDRAAVEAAYQQSDPELRSSMLDAALKLGEQAPVDLLRLAVFGFDAELGRKARQALAQASSPGAVDLVVEALRVPMDAGERDALVGALERLSAASPRARALAVVYRGLTGQASAVDVNGWTLELENAEAPPASDRETMQAELLSRAAAVETQPGDAAALLALAEANLALAVDPAAKPLRARLLFEDARRDALEAERLGAGGWNVNAVVALASYYLGDTAQAHVRAEAAVASMPPEAQEWSAMAVLSIFVQARQEAIAKAVRDKIEWPPQWLTDLHGAYSVLARHPLGTDAQVVGHYEFLKWLGADDQAARVLEQGLARFPDSWDLHERLRRSILREKGLAELEATYENMLRAENPSPNLEWFAGYASIVTAEYHRRAGRDAWALDAYQRALDHYQRAVAANPAVRDTADHFAALALAGRARLAFEQGDDERALAELLASFARKPEAAGTLDGLNVSPADTARLLQARLTERQRNDLLAQLQAALDRLDPELLRLPAYEREAAPAGPADAERPPRRRRD